MANSNLEVLFIIFIAITGVAVSLQACVLLAMFLTLRKAVTSAMARSEGFEAKIAPILETSHKFLAAGQELVESTRTLVTKLDPRVQSTIAELEAVSKDIHVQATKLHASVEDVAQMARRQAERVDGMTTSFLNGVDRVGNFVNQAVDVPIRQASGVIAAVKAVVETLRSPASPRPRRTPRPASAGAQPAYETDDKDLFV